MPEVENPTKMTDEVVQKLEEVLALDGTVEEACFFANISKQSYYNWINSFPEWKERFDAIRNNPFLKARRTIYESLSEPQYAFEYMKRKKKDEFSDRSELTGKDGKELQPILVKFIENENDRNSDRVQETL